MRYFTLLCITLFLVIVGLAGVSIFQSPPQFSPHFSPPPVSTQIQKSESLHNFPVASRGIHSFEQVRALMNQGHYSDIDFGSLQIVVVQREFMAYSQYFRNGKMLWTTHMTLVKTGTVLYCDKNGQCINTECGNELSLTPRNPVDMVLEPILDEPITTPVTQILPPPPYLPPTMEPPPSTPPTGSYPPYVPPTFCCGDTVPNTPTSVPEPSALGLMLVGLAMIFGFRKIR